MTGNRHLQLKDMKVHITDTNKFEIRVDEDVNSNTFMDFISHISDRSLTYKKIGPSSRNIRTKYNSVKDKNQYLRQAIKDTDRKENIDKELRLQAKRELVKMNNGDNRFITPAT